MLAMFDGLVTVKPVPRPLCPSAHLSIRTYIYVCINRFVYTSQWPKNCHRIANVSLTSLCIHFRAPPRLASYSSFILELAKACRYIIASRNTHSICKWSDCLSVPPKNSYGPCAFGSKSAKLLEENKGEQSTTFCCGPGTIQFLDQAKGDNLWSGRPRVGWCSVFR